MIVWPAKQTYHPGSCARLIKFELCREEYVSATRRAPRLRFGEHHLQARCRKEETARRERTLKNHPDVQLTKTSACVLEWKGTGTAQDRDSIKIREG